MTDKLRILVVTNTYPTAEKPGDTPQIKDQVDALKSNGVEVEVMYIDRYKGKRSYAEAAWRIFFLSFGRQRYDLIQAYYGHCGLIARLQLMIPVVVTFLGSDLLSPRDGRIGKLAARFADGLIVQSEEMKRIAKRDDALIIPFGVNLRLFKPSPADVSRHDLGLAMDEKLVLFPWNPARTVKRYDVIQEAVRIVQEKVGRIRLIPVFDQPHEIVAKYMNACDVMVLASEHEGSPMGVREAMACNLPIVSVDVGDIRQLIESTEGCYLCKRDPVDMAEKLCLAIQFGARTNGVNIVRQADAAWGAEQMIQLYETVLSGRRHSVIGTV